MRPLQTIENLTTCTCFLLSKLSPRDIMVVGPILVKHSGEWPAGIAEECLKFADLAIWTSATHTKIDECGHYHYVAA